MAGPYQVTVYTALPGTPLVDMQGRPDGTSAAGHMWYEVSDGKVGNSYGFAPKEHGAASGAGKGYRTDTKAYQSPAFARTMEITEEQYTRLKQYGEAAVDEDWRYFKGEYNGATNSCVDFTWGALKHAGFEIHRPEVVGAEGEVIALQRTGPIERFFDGRLQPARNIKDIQQIVDPMPGSALNSERFKEPSDRSWFQKLISENDLGTPQQRETAQRFREQLGDRLGQLGMSDQQVSSLAAAAAKEQTRFAGQGDVQSFLLSKHCSKVAMCQSFPPLREIDVGSALAQSERSHWSEAVAMARERSKDLAMESGVPSQAQAAQQMDAPVLSRG
ncbi:hypothetical protein [Hydrogenophaga flava]|uniref:hypothetical protein n=1 Tax=Hydrogenophaga flava TaxID=65657 RepID=UPI000825D4B6|nr:hypothetical protein [Hydrogenophaga flava]